MFRLIAILAILASTSLAACPAGCLKCISEDSKQKCEVCDLTRFFYLQSDGSCKAEAQTNCLVPSLNIDLHKCTRCSKDFFYDELAKTCVGVPSTKVQQGCLYYTPAAECAECEGDMYVSSGKCVAVPTKVDKCLLYDSAGNCVDCQSNYRRNEAGSECLSFEAIEHCRIHTDYGCQSCKSGFFYAFNRQLLNQATLQQVQNALLSSGDRIKVENNLAEECVPQNISNCSAYDSYGRCQTCENGYYSDPITGKCLLANESKIFKCKKYQDAANCLECEEGYYLLGDKCEPRTKAVANCKTLVPNAQTCKVCTDDWYIDSGACLKRLKSIHVFGCIERPINKDICSKCKDGMLKSTDELKCFFPIPNCATPKIPASTGTLECTTCHTDTIPTPNTTNTTSCVVRKKPNCKTFTSNHSEVCQTCHDNYFQTGGNCTPYTKKCKVRKSAADECESCFNYQYLKVADKTCHNYTVKNCNVKNDNEDKCTNCLAGHYLDQTTFSCLKYNLYNCKTENDNENKCTTCKDNLFKQSDTRCVPLDLPGCSAYNYSAGNCTTCNQGFYNSGGACIAQKIPGCLHAQLSLVAATCNGCSPGFYLPSAKTACVPYTVTHCKAGQLKADEDKCVDCLAGFHKTAAGKCIPFTEWNCKTMDDNGVCTACETGYYLHAGTKKCVLQARTGCKDFTANTNTCTNCKPWFYKSGTNCVPISIPNCTTPDTNATANSCANGCNANHYWHSSSASCLLKDLVGCSAYTTEKTVQKCQTPIDVYFKNNDSTAKVPVPRNLPHCYKQKASNKDHCETCVDGYYPLTGACTKRVAKANCILYTANTNNCEQCENLMKVVGGACVAIANPTWCAKSDGKAEKCTTCKPQYKIAAATCAAVSPLRTVANCLGSTLTTEVNCSVCNSGYTIIAALKFARELPSYCESMSSTDGSCTQIREGFECSAPTTCFPIKDVTSPCIKLKPSQTVLISVATQCSKCRNYRTHFLAGGTCQARTSASKNCSIYNQILDKCIACVEGLTYKAANANNTCSEAVATDNNTHCKSTMFGAPNCYECEEGYVKNNSSSFCEANRSTEEVGCRVVDNTVTNGPRCTKCREGFILVTSTKKCIKDETCYRNASGVCTYCWEDYRLIPGSTVNCAPKLNKDGCQIHSVGIIHSIANTEGGCVRCKDHNKVPYNVYDSTSTPKLKHYCKENGFIDLKYNVYVQSGATKKFEPVVLPWNHLVVPDDMIQTEAPIKPLINGTGVGKIDDIFCLDIRVPRCFEYDTTNFDTKGVYPLCKTCEAGFYLSTNSRFGQKCKRGNITGCQLYESEHKCKTCHNGFYVKADKTICIKYQDIPNCTVYENSKWACAQCLDGYVTLGGVCVKSKEKNCLHYFYNQNLCLQCENNYYLENYLCRPYSVENCDVLQKTRDRCVLCKENYYLNGTNGSCYKNTTKRCSIRSKTQNRCVSCDEGLFQDATSSDCIEITISDCLQQDPENGKCLICMQGYYLTKEDTCQPYSLDNCNLFEPYEDRCMLCENDYYLNEYGICLQHTIEHCKLLDPRRNSCLDCQSNAFQLRNGLCSLYTVRNCNIFQRIRDGCVSCLPGFYMDSAEKCVPYRLAKNCLVYNPYRDECRECLPHHFMSVSHCYKYTVNNCRVFKQDADICVDCDKGFFLEDNVCEPYTMNNCSEFSLNQNKCLGCSEGDYLEDGLCKPNTALFCTKKSPYSNTCLGCPDEFYLDSGVCLPRVLSTNCKRAFLTADLCDTCFATHYKAAGRCISYGRKTCKTFNSDKDLCTACETGKYWLSNHICEPYTVMHCKTPDPTKDKCTGCIDGPYYLGSDKICQNSTNVANCVTYNKVKNECTVCKDDHYLHSKSECRKNPSGIYKCKHYATNTTCAKCELGYYVHLNYCERSTILIDNCFNYVEDGKCGQCLPDYTLTNNSCFKHIEGTCKTWADSDNCASCGVNQVLNKNSLNKTACEASGIDNCLEAVRENAVNKCTVCVQGMYPANNGCVVPESPIAGCERYESASICKECKALYTLNPEKSGCFLNSKFLTPNCGTGQQFAKPVCKVCSAGFLLQNGNTCVQCGGDGCDLCDPWNSQKCLMCSPGYDHDGTKCTKPVTQAVTQNGKAHKFFEKNAQIWNLLQIMLFGLIFGIRTLH